MTIQLTSNKSKAEIKIDSDSKNIINDIKSILMLKKDIKAEDNCMYVDINGVLKINLDDETLIVCF